MAVAFQFGKRHRDGESITSAIAGLRVDASASHIPHPRVSKTWGDIAPQLAGGEGGGAEKEQRPIRRLTVHPPSCPRNKSNDAILSRQCGIYGTGLLGGPRSVHVDGKHLSRLSTTFSFYQSGKQDSNASVTQPSPRTHILVEHTRRHVGHLQSLEPRVRQ